MRLPRRKLLGFLVATPWLAAASQAFSAGAAGDKFMALSRSMK